MYMDTHRTHDMAKTIAIANDVYEMLSREKLEGESFSDVIRRLGSQPGSLLECAGILLDVPEKEFNRFRTAALGLDRPLSKELGWKKKGSHEVPRHVASH